MEIKGIKPLFQYVPHKTRYEYAPLTTMQAVAQITLCLYKAERYVSPGGLGLTMKYLLRAAQLLDMLCEKELHCKVARLHSSLYVSCFSGQEIHVESIILTVQQLQADWTYLLRESCTKWCPSTGN